MFNDLFCSVEVSQRNQKLPQYKLPCEEQLKIQFYINLNFSFFEDIINVDNKIVFVLKQSVF